jgi:hypothetical protein
LKKWGTGFGATEVVPFHDGLKLIHHRVCDGWKKRRN